MSIEALTWALGLDIVPSARKFVLVVLANYASPTSETYPSQQWLAEKTGQSARAVRAHLVALENAGYILRTGRRTSDGVAMTDIYNIVMQPAADSATGRQRQILPVEGKKHTTILPKENKPLTEKPPVNQPAADSATNTKEVYTKEREGYAPPSDSLFPETAKPPKEKKNGKTECPPDFAPDAESLAECQRLRVDPAAVLAEFRDWCRAKRPRYSDWQATFRNSARRAARYSGNRQGGQFSGRREPTSVVDAALRAAARHSGAG